MNIEHTDLIDRYYRGLMGTDERQAFEKEIKEDAELKAEFLLQRDIIEGMHYHFNAELKSKLHQSDQGGRSGRENNRYLFHWLAVAAAASFFFLAGYLWIFSPSSPEALYQAYYQPYPNIINPTERSGNQLEDILSQAMRAYEHEDYQSAIRLFQSDNAQLNSSYQFYLALCFLETSDYQSSISTLEEVLQSGNEAYALPALWYQSMAYLALGNTQAAQTILQKIAKENDGFYSKKASKLLDEL